MGCSVAKGQEEYQRVKNRKGPKQKPANTTLRHFLSVLLPPFCIRFLWSQPDEFRPTKFLLGAGFGGFFALGISQLLIFPMSITEGHKIQLMCGMAGVGALGWGTSPHFRCASLLVIPKFLGKEGRIYVLTYVLAAIYDGPVANIRHNLGEVVRSISCTVELQIENVKRAWKVSIAPLRKILMDMVGSGKTFRAETQQVSRSFSELNEQVASEAGYKVRSAREAERKPGARPSTQDLYEMKTRMRCTYIINQAIARCQDWFETKYKSCLRTIVVPVISHLLCVPMKFSFICHLTKIMHVWCRDKIPVDGNFGQTYDRVNGSVDNLNRDFSSSLVVKEEHQTMLVGANISHEHLVDEINEQVALHSSRLGTAMSVLHVLLSCTFILVFASAYSYINSYNQDIRFDNIYITRYFRQIDARRRKQKKHTLLPLRRAEVGGFIDPRRLCFQPAESKAVMLELLGCLPSLVVLLLACFLDYLLYTIFSTIQRHSFVQYSFHSSHHLEVKVGGKSMLARLLRSTIGALNTSSRTVLEATNVHCLPDPRGMSRKEYLATGAPLGVLVLLCLLQVYVYRLRRVVAAFYFPKREKKRILFLYNEMLRRRLAFVTVQRKRIIQRAQRRKRLEKPVLDRLGHWFPFLKRFIRRRCILCNLPESRNSLLCATPDCATVYCRLCWKDMGEMCFACRWDDEVPSEDGGGGSSSSSSSGGSEGQAGYAD